IDIMRVGIRDFGQFFFSGRIDGIEIFAGARRHKLSADEQLIAWPDLDVIACFRGGRVAPTIAEGKFSLVRWYCSGAMINRAVPLYDDELRALRFFSSHHFSLWTARFHGCEK